MAECKGTIHWVSASLSGIMMVDSGSARPGIMTRMITSQGLDSTEKPQVQVITRL
jgi:hypothetical protein